MDIKNILLFQKDRHKTVGGVTDTKYILSDSVKLCTMKSGIHDRNTINGMKDINKNFFLKSNFNPSSTNYLATQNI